MNEFLRKIDECQQILYQTPGLDMTEEEQIQKINDLQEAIKQKQHLIEECTKCFESWNIDQPE